MAIVQELLASNDTADDARPLGTPTLDNVTLASDGSVACEARINAGAVLDVALLLQAMLSANAATRIPGALRYAIARALRTVDAPPFASMAAFSAVLKRHETGDRRAVLQHLYARSHSPQETRAGAAERRQRSLPVAELRRQLRDADLERYAALVHSTVPVNAPIDAALPKASHEIDDPIRPVAQPELNRRRVAAAAAAVVLAFAAGYGVVAWLLPAANPSEIPTVTTNVPARAPAATVLAEGPRSDDDWSIVRNPLIARAVPQLDEASFSPWFGADATTLFFHTGRSADPRSALKAAEFASGSARVTTIIDDGSRNFHVRPSPSGDRIAFDSDRDGQRGVYIAARDGSGSRKISGAGYAAVPTWSPDGTQLTFVRAETGRRNVWNLWLMTIATGEVRRLTRFTYGQTWGGSWFNDGRRVCYTHEDALFVYDLASAIVQRFDSPLRGRLVRTPAVSPDGHYIMFQVARRGAWLLDLRRKSMTPVLSDPTAEEFAWSRSGEVAFHSRRDGQWRIWLMKSG